MSFEDLAKEYIALDWSTLNKTSAELRDHISHAQHLLTRIFAARSERSNLFFVTINFKPESTVHSILAVMSKLAARSFVKRYAYNIEQRGETVEEMGKGIHSHFLIATDINQSHLEKYIFSSVRTMVGNKRHVDVRKYSMSLWNDKLDYIKGLKWDSDKDLKIEVDNLFREKNNIDFFYTNGATISPEIYETKV